MSSTGNALVDELLVTAEVCGSEFSEGAATMIVAELAQYDRKHVLGALKACRREVKGRLTMAAILERLDDGRPGPDEAWAMIPKDEASSVVWTEEMAQAFGVALRLIEAGEHVAARMAFRECYTRLVAKARDEKAPVNWTPSLGHDPRGRDAALRIAVDKGRLPLDHALSLGYDMPPVSQDMMALEYGERAVSNARVSAPPQAVRDLLKAMPR